MTRGAKRAGGTKENEEVTQKRTRFILAFACLAILALAALYQLQIQQSADSQGIAWENTRANAQENTLAAPSSSTEGSLTPSTASEPSASLTIPDASQSVESPAAALDTSLTARELPASVRLEVPLIMQLPELPTGCEATATAMMLQYAGSSLTKLDVATEMPYSDNPSEGFVGNPFTADGFTIYPSALMRLVRAQLGSAVDLSGATLTELQGVLQGGKPVCCWIADDQGYVHCVVATGYGSDIIYLNDPLEGATSMSVSEFEHLWANNARRALSY